MKKRRTKGPKVRFPGNQGYISDAINQVVSWVEGLPFAQEIKAGPNIFIRQDDETCIIESTAAPVAATAAVASNCTFGLEKYDVDTDAKSYKLRATGGLVNGLIPTNFENIGNFSSTEKYYLYIKATTGNTGISSLEYLSDTALPAITPQVSEAAPPTEFKILVAYLNEGTIKTVICQDIQANPTVYSYAYDSSGKLEIKWWWQISAYQAFSNNTSTV